MKIIKIILISLFLVSCTQSDLEKQEQKVIEEMGWLYEADPKKDALAAIERQDFRFMGVYGYSLTAPNVPQKCFDNYERFEKSVLPIKGTTDAVFGYEHVKLNSIAYEYASFYNIIIVHHLKDDGNWRCDL